MSAAIPTWSCERLTCRYPGAPAPALDAVTLDVPAGALTAVLGPNGSGKSTLLKALLGTVRPTDGTVRHAGRPLSEWPRAALAREVGVVPQEEPAPFPLTVRELVAMGRYPHLGAWRAEGAEDAAAIARAMERCDVAAFADRPMDTLSGGERQRARVARALAQEPRALALDEPTASLDVRHEMEIFELLRALRAGGVTVVLVTHNLNLAARYADGVVVLDRGVIAGLGAPAGVLDAALVERVYAWPVDIVRHRSGAPQVVPRAAAERAGAPS